MKSIRGFTLMEVLVALVLMTVFTVVTYRALDAVLETQRRVSAEMERWREMAAAFAWLDADLSHAVTRVDARDPTGTAFHSRTEESGAVQFDLVRLLPEDADEGLQKLGYRCEEKKLMRLVWPEVDNLASAPKAYGLLEGLRACAFRYMDSSGQWAPAWLPAAKQLLPRAVELTLVAGDGTPVRRVWRVQ
jgi:general secretion pathway protein J